MKTTENLANIVKEVQSGNNSSFEKLYYESYKYLHTCVINIVKDENTAEDMLQEAYTEIFKSISQLNNPYDFLSWAATIANRKCFAYIKKQKDVLVGENTDDEGNETDYFESIPDDEAFIPENILDNQEKIKIIRGIIDDLTDIQRACVIGFYYNDQKQEEIASELDIPVNTVKSHLSRAKSKIKDAVGETEKKQGIKLFAIPAFLSLLFAKQTEVYAAEMAVPAMGAALSSAVSTASTTAAAVTSAGEASTATSTATVSSLGEVSVTASTTAETIAGAAAKGAATKAIAGAAAKGAATKVVAGTAVKAAAMAVKTKIIIAAAVGAVTIASVGGGTAVAVTEHHKTVEREARIQRELEEREEKAKEEEGLKAEAKDKAKDTLEIEPKATSETTSEEINSEKKSEISIDYEQLFNRYYKALDDYCAENGVQFDYDSEFIGAVIYLNDDDIPDIMLTNSDMGSLYGYSILLMDRGDDVYVQGDFISGDSITYIPQKGLICYEYGRWYDYYEEGEYYTSIDSFDSGEVNNVLSGRWVESYDSPNTYYIYCSELDEEEVSEEEYYKRINQVFPEEEEKIIQYNYTFEELKKAFLSGNVPTYDPNAEWKEAYKSCVENIFDSKEMILDGGDAFFYSDIDRNDWALIFFLKDITDDGIPELLIRTSDSSGYYAYTIEDGTYKLIELGEGSFIVGFDTNSNKIYVSSYISIDTNLDVYDVENGKISFSYSIYDDSGEEGEVNTSYYRYDGNQTTAISKQDWISLWDEYQESKMYISDIRILNPDTFEKCL